ncbi:MAG: SPOR domain-containing protein [Pelagibacterales bacterium]|nr:SPOR domain-containing protein [Pelagibacterales bacterium]
MRFKRAKIVVLFYLFLLISCPLIGQEINQSINKDSSIYKLLKLKTDYNKKIFESSFYTIQIFYGDLKEADSISKVFSEEFEEIKTSLIFETPNYKVRVGVFKTLIDASKSLENIKRKFRGAFILKNDEL